MDDIHVDRHATFLHRPEQSFDAAGPRRADPEVTTHVRKWSDEETTRLNDMLSADAGNSTASELAEKMQPFFQEPARSIGALEYRIRALIHDKIELSFDAAGPAPVVAADTEDLVGGLWLRQARRNKRIDEQLPEHATVQVLEVLTQEWGVENMFGNVVMKKLAILDGRSANIAEFDNIITLAWQDNILPMILHKHFKDFKWGCYLGRAPLSTRAVAEVKKCISTIPDREFNSLGLRGCSDCAALVFTMSPNSDVTEKHTGELFLSFFQELPDHVDCKMLSDMWDGDRADNPHSFYFVLQGGIEMQFDTAFKDRYLRSQLPVSYQQGICLVPPSISIDLANKIKIDQLNSGNAGGFRGTKAEKARRIHNTLYRSYGELCPGCGLTGVSHTPQFMPRFAPICPCAMAESRLSKSALSAIPTVVKIIKRDEEEASAAKQAEQKRVWRAELLAEAAAEARGDMDNETETPAQPRIAKTSSAPVDAAGAAPAATTTLHSDFGATPSGATPAAPPPVDLDCAIPNPAPISVAASLDSPVTAAAAKKFRAKKQKTLGSFFSKST